MQGNSFERKGNFVEYDGINDVLHIIRVIDDYCKPEEEACRCNPLLDSMFSHLPVYRLAAINRIVTRVDVTHMEYLDGCICYLGAMARAGFHFTKMAGTQTECTERKALSTEWIQTFEVCRSYIANGCGNEKMTITKT